MSAKIAYLHGMGGSAADWRWVENFIPGLSLQLDGAALDSPHASAVFLAKTITREFPGPFALCGYSMGGRLAILTAKELIGMGRPPSSLLLASTGLGFSDSGERAARLAKDAVWADLAQSNPVEFWRLWYEQDLFSSYRALPAESREAWTEARKSLQIGSLSKQLRALGPASHEDLRPVLQDMAVKGHRVLYIVGELDKKYLELSREVKKMAGVTVSVIANAGHILPLEAPEQLATRIKEFLD